MIEQNKLGIFFRSVIGRILLCGVLILFIVPLIFFMILPRSIRYRSRFLFWFVNAFYRSILFFSFLPITYKGKSNVPNEPVIFAANHQSSLDIPLLGVLAKGTPHIWLAKEELMESFILRWILPKVAILVNVESPKKAVRSLLEVISFVEDKNCHVMIFPEGGRYPGDQVHEFYRGFVVLAKKLGRPVVPVYIWGVNKVYPPDSFYVYWHPITVVVGEPMSMGENETDEEFKDRVYQWFIQQSKDYNK